MYNDSAHQLQPPRGFKLLRGAIEVAAYNPLFAHLLITAAMACKVLWFRVWVTPILLWR